MGGNFQTGVPMKRLLALTVAVMTAAPAYAFGFGEALFQNQMQLRQLELQERELELRARGPERGLRERMETREILDTQRELLRLERERQLREKLDGIGQPWRMENLR